MLMSFLELTSHSVYGAIRKNRALDMHVSTYFCCQSATFFDELQEALQETDSDLGNDPDGLDPDADHQELLQPVE